MEFEINKRQKFGKSTNMWELSRTHLSNQWIKEEIIMEIKNTLKWMKVKIQHSNTYGMQLQPSLEGYLEFLMSLLKRIEISNE